MWWDSSYSFVTYHLDDIGHVPLSPLCFNILIRNVMDYIL